MVTTVEAVRRHLEEDQALLEVLLRDLVNLRRTARWLISEYEWDTTEEAVVSALRRFREEGRQDPIWSARDQLYRTSLELRDGLSLVTIPRTPEVQRTALTAWFEMDGSGLIGVLPGRTQTRLLVEKTTMRNLSDKLGARSIHGVSSPVSLLRLVFPESEAQGALISLVASALARKRVPLIEVISCDPEWLILVPDDKTLEAHGILSRLLSEETPL